MNRPRYAEAEQAAQYIGRQHTFVLSQRTATWGGNQSMTRSDTYGYGDSDSSSVSWQELSLGRGTRSGGKSTSRNWSTGSSWADGTSWSDATTVQRVYEYAVEPAVLQNLPDHALLLTAAGPAHQQLLAVECDPDISALAGHSTRPPQPLLIPAQASAAELPPATPTWPSSAGYQPRPASYVPRHRG